MAQTFYRIVKTGPPRRRDFVSNAEKRGDPRPDLPASLRRLWDGLSVHTSEAQARRQAQETPWLGEYIAELRIPEQTQQPVRWERTIPNNPGHHTLWGDADELLGCVVRVVPVREVPDGQHV